jgi:4-aminobutyrate aminotransferase-like enzyme
MFEPRYEYHEAGEWLKHRQEVSMLVDAAHEKGTHLKNELLALKDKHEIIGGARGRGPLMGVDFVTLYSREWAMCRTVSWTWVSSEC